MEFRWAFVRLGLVTFGAYMSSCFMYYHRVVLNNLQYPMKQSIAIKEAQSNSTKSNALIMPFLLSAVNDGIVIGFLFNFWICDRFGRRKMAILYCVAYGFAVLVLLGSMALNNDLTLLTINRLLTGIIYSMNLVNNLVMIAECAPTKYRTLFASLSCIFLGLSEPVASFVASPFCFGNVLHWPYAILIGYAHILLCLPILIWAHDSPRFLFLIRNDREQAARSIQFYQGMDKVEETLIELENEQSRQRNDEPNISYKSVWATPKWRRSVILLAVLGINKQLLGDTLLCQFSTQLLQFMGYSYKTASSCTIAAGCVLFVSAVIGPPLVHFFNQRRLTLWSCAYSLGAMIALAALTLLMDRGKTRAAIAFSIIMTSFFIHNVLLACVCAYRVELLPQAARSKGVNIYALCSATMCALISFILPMAFRDPHSIFWLLSITSVLATFGLVYHWRKLPNTSKTTFQETQDELSRLINLEKQNGATCDDASGDGW